MASEAKLRWYQEDGVKFVLGGWEGGHGVILADEMGLGKTAQSIAALERLAGESGTSFRALVLCPLSVLRHWASEVPRFGPRLKPLVFHADKEAREELKARAKGDAAAWNLCLTTYEVLIKDADFLAPFRFDAIVVDEAHRLKNHNSLLYATLTERFSYKRSILLSGTPVQNNLRELYSLLHFVDGASIPLSDMDGFVGRLEGKEEESTEMRGLRKELAKYMLRRTKELVWKEMPELSQVILYHGLSPTQRELYRAILSKNYAAFGEAEGEGRRQSLQNTLMQLRKCAAHPYLFAGVEPEPFEEGEHLVEASAKLAALDLLLEHCAREGHRVLLFSQMTSTLDILQDYLGLRRWAYERLDGSVRSEERFEAVERFAKAETFVFLLSTRAGGLGLTLTAADTVVFYDSDFNPHNDLQAAARAHRIGQTKPVRVVRLVGRHTVEEVMLQRAQHKLRLTQAVVQDQEAGADDHLTAAQISDFITKGLGQLTEEADDKAPQLDLDSLLGKSRDGCWQSLKPCGTSEGLKAEAENIYEFEGEDYKKVGRAKDREALDAMVAEAQALAASDSTAVGGRRGKPVIRFALEKMEGERKRKPLTPEQLAQRREKAEARRKEKMEAAEAERLAKREALWRRNGYVSSALLAPPDQDDEEEDGAEAVEPEFLVGDVTHPRQVEQGKDALILHVVDDSGVWARGGVFGALSRRSPSVEVAYAEAGRMRDLGAGSVHLVPADDVESRQGGGRDFAALLVAQDRKQRRRIDQAALAEGLRRVAAYVGERPGTTVHMPRIGFRVPGVNWYAVERLVRRHLSARGVPVTIYYFKANAKRQAPQGSGSEPAKRAKAEEPEDSTEDAAATQPSDSPSSIPAGALSTATLHVSSSVGAAEKRRLEGLAMRAEADVVVEETELDGAVVVVAEEAGLTDDHRKLFAAQAGPVVGTQWLIDSLEQAQVLPTEKYLIK